LLVTSGIPETEAKFIAEQIVEQIKTGKSKPLTELSTEATAATEKAKKEAEAKAKAEADAEAKKKARTGGPAAPPSGPAAPATKKPGEE
jgi:membrane protein involved in colicin uptake